MNAIINYALDKIKKKVDENCVDGNVGTSERVLSVVAGGLIFGIGLKRIIKNPLIALSSVSIGSALVYRGITGKCQIKSILDNVKDEKDEVTVIEHRYFVK